MITRSTCPLQFGIISQKFHHASFIVLVWFKIIRTLTSETRIVLARVSNLGVKTKLPM